ncbi:hypothetical protein ACT3UD_18265 [Glutamicibacter sp. 287]|uniref:hypothetical protein n=1 Tax=Glutamicibacter sp. 287 TaxID=3457732 RepID=UPI004034A3F8
MDTALIETLPHLIGAVDPTFALVAILSYLALKKVWPVIKDLQGVPERVTKLERVTDEHGEDIYFLKLHTEYTEPPVKRRQ